MDGISMTYEPACEIVMVTDSRGFEMTIAPVRAAPAFDATLRLTSDLVSEVCTTAPMVTNGALLTTSHEQVLPPSSRTINVRALPAAGTLILVGDTEKLQALP